MSSARCNRVASGCGGSTPPVRIARVQDLAADASDVLDTRGDEGRSEGPINGRGPGDEVLLEERLACIEEERVRLPPSPLTCLRSVNSKHAPFVRPRCGFKSCRRLLRTPTARWIEHCLARAEDAGSTPAGRTHADVAQTAKAPGRQPGEARSTRVVRSHEGPWCNGKHSELQPRWSGFDSWGGLLEAPSRAGAARLSGRERARTRVPLRFDSAPDRTPRPRHTSAAGRTVPVIDYESTGRGFESRPERSVLR